MAKAPASDEKAKRLAAALRENLKRRKAQARGKAAEGVSAPDDAGGSGPGRPNDAAQPRQVKD